jgi:hypothetical protein
VLFKHDVSLGHKLAELWERVAPVRLGGVAFDERGGDFIPGMYVKKGAVITSRGCNNRCWFCSVWRRDGEIRELTITEGWNVLDDNLLACSESHIRKVFEMLHCQKLLRNRILFTGGLDTRLLKDWHIDLLVKLKPRRMFFACDSDTDLEPLIFAAWKLREAGFTRSHLSCYVLIGYYGDTFDKAEMRLNAVIGAGFTPMAMLYMEDDGSKDLEWKQFQRKWARPAIIFGKYCG